MSETALRVKLIASWAPSAQVCEMWDRMSQGDLRWNDIQVTASDDADFFVILDWPWEGEFYKPERTIVFQMEPWCALPSQTWGVKTWGEWSRPDPTRFLQVRSHRQFPNNGFWQLAATYHELRTRPIVKTGTLASIISGKYFDPGHVQRVDFLRYIERRDDDVVRVDMYAYDNPLGFSSWVGPHPPGLKDAALLPYRYFLGVENNREHNFITEKLYEPLLTETLCFYSGAPNADEHIDPRAFIAIDLDDFDQAFHVIREAILRDEWSRRIEYIRREKRKVLEHLQFFPTLERVLRHEFRFSAPPNDREVAYHKYFAADIGRPAERVAFLHSYTRDHDTSILRELLRTIEGSGLLTRLDRLYIVNVGDEISLPPEHQRSGGKIRLIHRTDDASLAEKLTLDLVHDFAFFHPEARLLYLHTKGASGGKGRQEIADWRRLMAHTVVDRFEECLTALDHHDAVGCELTAAPRPHFSGNFWWARADHVNSLAPVPAGDRHEAEMWVLNGGACRALSLHDSGVDHYEVRYPPAQYAPSQHASSSICLAMIVRDAAPFVEETLASVADIIDHWVVVDTGSVDDTAGVVQRFFDARGIPGSLEHRPWVGFAHNRTEAIALCRGRADYAFMVDADDLLVGTPDLQQLTADCYRVRFGPGFTYWRPALFHLDRQWEYRGALHEYPVCLEEGATFENLGGDHHFVFRSLGGRGNDPQRFQRDVAVLTADWEEHPGDARTAFYLAQSHRDARDDEQAMEWYARRATMPGWVEETYVAMYEYAKALERTGAPTADIVAAHERASAFRPSRAESLYALARHYRLAGEWQAGYDAACRADEVPFPDDTLFVHGDVYRWSSTDERAICAHYLGRHEETVELCEQLLRSPDLPLNQRDRVLGNRNFSIAHVAEARRVHRPDLVRLVAARVSEPRPDPQVTLTITTCRRRDLFERTIDSFLACCSDIEAIDRWICIDDGSSAQDRAAMQARYPFFEFIFEPEEMRGHARSMNRLLAEVSTPYWLHLEDDWDFVSVGALVTHARAVLDDDPTLLQVVLNRDYAETLAHDRLVGSELVCGEHAGAYRRHVHRPHGSSELDALFRDNPGCQTNAHWPGFSLMPSMIRTAAIKQVGAFNPGSAHFERDMAVRAYSAGWGVGFLDTIVAVTTGRLRGDSRPDAPPNAYALNGMAQFARHTPAAVYLVPSATGDGADVRDEWRRQFPAEGSWNGVCLTSDPVAADLFLVTDRPAPGVAVPPPDRTVVVQTRPADGAEPAPDLSGFAQVRSFALAANVARWTLPMTYDQVWVTPALKTADRSPGTGDLAPYRYTVVVEDVAVDNHFSPRLVDAVVSECLTFYWGCPNLEAILDPDAFIRLPTPDVAAHEALIADALVRGEYERRLPALRRAKRRILEDLQLAPTLARVAAGIRVVEGLSVHVINLDRRPDRLKGFRQRFETAAGPALAARCERFTAIDGADLVLTDDIAHMFRGSEFPLRRAQTACALGHLALWTEVATGDGTPALIFEDDAVPGADFRSRLVEVCSLLEGRDDGPDVVFLGVSRFPDAAAPASPVQCVRPFDPAGLMGGTFAYVITRRGAQRLLEIARRDGIAYGIDTFLMRQAGALQILTAVPEFVTAPVAVRDAPPVDSDIQYSFDTL